MVVNRCRGITAMAEVENERRDGGVGLSYSREVLDSACFDRSFLLPFLKNSISLSSSSLRGHCKGQGRSHRYR